MATDITETPDAAEAGAPEAAAKLTQKVEIKDVGPCKKHVKVTVDRAAIDARFDEKFTELVFSDQPSVRGFRPGKAPRKMIEQRYFKSVAEEVKTQVLMASLEQLAEEQSISPLAPPELDPHAIVIPKEGDFVYEFNIEVRPEFDLPDYKGLKLRRPTHTPTAEDKETEKRRLLEPRGQLVPKEGETAAVALNDMLTCDVVIKSGDKELNKLSEVRVKVEKQLALADGVAVDFGKVMAGAKVGDTRTVDITLSQEVPTEALRGAKVQAAFTVNDVKEVRLPELTEEVLGGFGLATPEQFDELVTSLLERRLEYTQRQAARQQVLETIAASNNWELPQDMLKRQVRKTLARKVMEMRSSGMSDDQIRGRQRLLEQDALRSTASALKEHFVLQKVAEIEKIEIEDADIDAEVDRIADQSGESPRKVKARLEKEDLIEALATDLLERKALDLILASATYEDYALGAGEQGDEVATVSAQIVPGAEGEPAPPADGGGS